MKELVEAKLLTIDRAAGPGGVNRYRIGFAATEVNFLPDAEEVAGGAPDAPSLQEVHHPPAPRAPKLEREPLLPLPSVEEAGTAAVAGVLSSPTQVRERPPGDLAKAVVDLGVAHLGLAGIAENKARQLIGRWRKGRDPGAVLAALMAAQREGATDPVAFVEATLRRRAAQVINFPGADNGTAADHHTPRAARGAVRASRAKAPSFSTGMFYATSEIGCYNDTLPDDWSN
jgi:hypothetical protein